MTFLLIILCATCLFFFLSGMIAGYAILSGKFNDLVQLYTDLRTKTDSLNEELEKKCKENDLLIKEHTVLNENCSTLQKIFIFQKKKIMDLNQECLQYRAQIENIQISESNLTNDTEKIEYLQNENSKLTGQVNLQYRRLIESERYREYVVKFNEAQEMVMELRRQNIHLREEIKKLQSAGISLGYLGVKPFENEGSGMNGYSSVFDKILKGHAAKQGHRGAVLSDEMGFVISSTSQYSEELAAISVLFHYCEKVICDNIAFNSLSKISFVNNNNLFLTIAPILVGEQKVYYSGLTQGKLTSQVANSKVTEAVIYS
jgi:hypothetical protein